MPGKMKWEAIVEKQPGVWSDGKAMWKQKRFRARKATEDTVEKIWEDGEGRKKGLKRWLFIFKEGEERIRAEMVAVKKEAKIRNRVRRKQILYEK